MTKFESIGSGPETSERTKECFFNSDLDIVCRGPSKDEVVKRLINALLNLLSYEKKYSVQMNVGGVELTYVCTVIEDEGAKRLNICFSMIERSQHEGVLLQRNNNEYIRLKDQVVEFLLIASVENGNFILVQKNCRGNKEADVQSIKFMLRNLVCALENDYKEPTNDNPIRDAILNVLQGNKIPS